MDIIDFITSFFETSQISILEAIMLICWGLSWPVSVIKALRTKIVHGKSPLFMSLIAVGYLCGILNKALYSRDYLVLLYILNLTMILTDLYLYRRYNHRLAQKPPEIINKKITPEHGAAKNIIVDCMEQKQYICQTNEAVEILKSYDLPVLNSIRVRDRKKPIRTFRSIGAPVTSKEKKDLPQEDQWTKGDCPSHLSIPPFFVKYKKDVSLNNGTIIHIRPIRSEDESALRRFFETQSEESVFFRFGHLRINILHDHLARLYLVDYDQDIAFVAIAAGDTGEEIIIGEVRLNRLADFESAELSFIVDDQWQGKGVGNLLMAFCLKVAKEIGLKTLLMLVMKNNVRMKRFGYKYDFQKLPCKKEDDMEEWQLKLDQVVEFSLPTRKYPVDEMLSWQIPSAPGSITEINETSTNATAFN